MQNVTSTFHKMVFCAKVERMINSELPVCLEIISGVENLKRQLAEKKQEEQKEKQEIRKVQEKKIEAAKLLAGFPEDLSLTDFRIMQSSVKRNQLLEDRTKLFQFNLMKNKLYKDFRAVKQGECRKRQEERLRAVKWVTLVNFLVRLKSLIQFF